MHSVFLFHIILCDNHFGVYKVIMECFTCFSSDTQLYVDPMI